MTTKKHPEMQYLDYMQDMIDKIENWKLQLNKDRTWVGTYRETGWQMIFELEKWFPLLTSKKVYFHWVVTELIWFIRWDTNIKFLVDNNCKIWNEWAWVKNNKKFWLNLSFEDYVEKIKTDKEFAEKYWDLWPIYSAQWRKSRRNILNEETWEEEIITIDQLWNAIKEIKNNPTSRRIIVDSWNVGLIPNMWLPPCHQTYQFFVDNGKLDLHLYQRSADMFLGFAFNLTSYSLLIHIVAKLTGLKPWKFVHSIWDRHIYSNHIEQVKEQLSRKDNLYEFPTLIIKDRWQKTLEDFEIDDFIVENYQSHPTIKALVAV